MNEIDKSRISDLLIGIEDEMALYSNKEGIDIELIREAISEIQEIVDFSHGEDTN